MEYGRVSPSDSSRFFVGTYNMAVELNTFSDQISTFYTDSNTSLNASANIRALQTSFENAASTLYSTYTNDVYSNAFSSDGTAYVDVTSDFKDMHYGPLSNTSSILGKIDNHEAAIFTQVNSAIDPMITAWGRLEPKG